MSASRDGRDELTVGERIRARVVGRERELDLILAAVAACRDIILKGPGSERTNPTFPCTWRAGNSPGFPSVTHG